MSEPVLAVRSDGSVRQMAFDNQDGQTAVVMSSVRWRPPFNEWGQIPPDEVPRKYEAMLASRRRLFAFTGRCVDGLRLFAIVTECPICGCEIAAIYPEVNGIRQYGCGCNNLERLKWPIQRSQQ